MWNLFETNTAQVGYRLKTLEVFNWGTFHGGESEDTKQEIWKITPEGQNSLLTGINGSGKTTLVDALLALLVTPRKRFFNQSSGAADKKDRSEASYVEGHYGRTQNEEQANSLVEKLRKNRAKTYSIILGVFITESGTPVTLIQARWFNNSGLQCKYIVSRTEMSIAEHIQFSSDGSWLRKLNKQFGEKLEGFDTFTKYAAAFQRLFGMKSEKALTLFNQTVGMKVLGNLDEFIRTNMLEESSAEEKFNNLMAQYQTLLVSYKALEKARIQLELLKPIYDFNAEYEALNVDLLKNTEQKRLLDPWFAKQQIKIWKLEILNQERELKQLEDKLEQEEKTLEEYDEQRIQLEVSIGNNEINQKIKDLVGQIGNLEKSKKEKTKNAEDYNKLVRQLDFIENPDETGFNENLKSANVLQQELNQRKKAFEQQRIEENIKLASLKKEFESLKTEIEQLEKSSNKVTGRVAEIHQEIVEALGASRNEIPFVAEIIQVKTDEKAIWNNAIEKVLHGFGLCLLVPDKYYSSANQYINSQKDLRGKIKFLKVGKTAQTIFQDTRAMVNKLNFNAKSPYADWVESRIASRYNYFCVEDQTTFERLEKALLPSGYTKNKDSHERDDTQGYRQILGWDNRELLRELKLTAKGKSEEIAKIERSLQKLSNDLKNNDEQQKVLAIFLELKQFSKLDWLSDGKKISELTRQKTEIENSNATLKTLREQLNQLKIDSKALEEKRDITRDNFKDTEKLIQTLKKVIQEQTLFIENFDAENLEFELKILEELTHIIENQLNYQQFSNQKSAFEKGVSTKIANLEEEKSKQERKIRSAMSGYKSANKDIKDKFADWDSDTYNLGTEIDRLPEYIDKYEQIKGENLAELEVRFKDEFKSGVTKALSDFVHSLEIQHENIEQAIEEINDSLKDILYKINPDTFIQLERTDSRKPLIRDFRTEKLNSWQPDRSKMLLATDSKEAEIEHFVNKIQPFIKELQENEKWRQEVTDVRNWSDFKAREFYKVDKKPANVYESSSSLSGGEAAKLTYSILCASIAHQFGITKKNSGRSFRLVVVDEAFSKLDDNNSEHLLRLCKSLGLQLIAVTPETSIRLVENSVSTIHWVTKSKHHEHKSTVRDIPILEFKQKKEQFLAEIAAQA